MSSVVALVPKSADTVTPMVYPSAVTGHPSVVTELHSDRNDLMSNTTTAANVKCPLRWYRLVGGRPV